MPFPVINTQIKMCSVFLKHLRKLSNLRYNEKAHYRNNCTVKGNALVKSVSPSFHALMLGTGLCGNNERYISSTRFLVEYIFYVLRIMGINKVLRKRRKREKKASIMLRLNKLYLEHNRTEDLSV